MPGANFHRDIARNFLSFRMISTYKRVSPVNHTPEFRNWIPFWANKAHEDLKYPASGECVRLSVPFLITDHRRSLYGLR